MRRLALLSAGCLLALGASADAAPPDAIRVGGPSAPADAKVAIVGSAQTLRARAFTVVNSAGQVALRGKLAAAPGSPRPWRHAARADLSSLRTPGSYRVKVGSLTSATWVIRDGAASAGITAILGFFNANSDGNEPSAEHAAAHLNDAIVASGPHKGEHVDMTGGWMDAGDMLHFTQTTAYAAAALQASARMDPADAPALDDAADVGVRWLVKAHPAPDLFIGQVGDTRDHDVGFRNPAGDDASKRAGIGTRMAYPNMGGDIGGKVAAALALAADRADPAGRAALLTQAREWYAAGKASGKIAPKIGDFYVGDTAVDSLAAGAAALYRSTGEAAYAADAVRYLHEFDPDGRLEWNAMAAFAAADLCGGLGAPAAPDPVTRAAACDHLAAQARAAARTARRSAFATPGDFTWGQTGENGGAGALLALAGRAGVAPQGLAGAAAARDWLLGLNPWGASFVTGYGPHSPKHPHHWASIRGIGRPTGAVVGGPAPRKAILEQHVGTPNASVFNTAAATYEDRRADYVTSEPAIDYAAGSILNLAALR
ncbi:MAG TPA: glycoside hydrolase family 9 protein [Polyangia bacterium]|nr:glycoside hydrolase family 9 protein [Polyangia bacterium]